MMPTDQFIAADWDVASNVIARVTTRIGGVSQAPYNELNLADHVGDSSELVTRNRKIVADMLSDDLQWQWLQQVHGNAVVKLEEPRDSLIADGLITNRSGLVCCVLTADCLPVFIADVEGSEVAIVHAGWRGLVSGIIENAVGSMQTPPERLSVWLGPAIGPCHFEVGSEVREQFLIASQGGPTKEQTAACFQPGVESTQYMADLYALARIRIAALGVSRVTGGTDCSYCNAQQYYSFRRDKNTGRNLSLIYLQPA